MTHVGNKYAIMERDVDHVEGYVYQVYMNQQDFEQQYKHSSRILGQPSRASLIEDYWNNTRDNGFNVYFFAVFYSWFRMGALSMDDFSGGTDPDLDQPDLALFETLEAAIQHAHQRGGRTHIWAWGDNDRKQTPNWVGGGLRGKRHQRLMRYIAARLGPLPGWSMNFGFDTIEMPNAETDAAWWANEINRRMGWPHLLTSRGWANTKFRRALVRRIWRQPLRLGDLGQRASQLPGDQTTPGNSPGQAVHLRGAPYVQPLALLAGQSSRPEQIG